MDFTISENVFAGNAMNRRLLYQYGLLVPASPQGYVGQGRGQAVSAGAAGLIAPNRHIKDAIEEIEVDGVPMIFQYTRNTAAPREMNTYIPEMKALWMAENVTSTLHNIYTLRGAPVRDPLRWSKYIGEALYRFGLDAEVMFASHHWLRDNPDNDPCAVVWILNLGAGLDTRPYRMDLPRSLRFVEVDIRRSSI